MKEREIIKLSEIEVRPILNQWAFERYEEDYLNDKGIEIEGIWDDFERIDDSVHDYDLENGYIVFKVIVQRKSDGKYFKGFYTDYVDYIEKYETTLTEVFPIEKTIIAYE